MNKIVNIRKIKLTREIKDREREREREGGGRGIRIFLWPDTEPPPHPPRLGWWTWKSNKFLPFLTSRNVSYLQNPGLGQASQSNMFSRSAKTEPKMFSNILLMFLHSSFFLGSQTKITRIEPNLLVWFLLIKIWKKFFQRKLPFNTHFSVIIGSFGSSL